MKSVVDATHAAERLLPGVAAADGDVDPRWQAIIEVSEFLNTEPEPIWHFILRWSRDADDDLQAALGTCLLEHLLEDHFDEYFPRVVDHVSREPGFAGVFLASSKFGQSTLPGNAVRFDALKAALGGWA